jgi:hypothetical protein
MLAPADNLIEITATDANGGTMSETRTVSFREPEVMAAIATPADGSTWRSYASIPLDGSTSQGENGLEARWVFFSGADGEALPGLEQPGLNAAVSMPHGYGGLKARLVVAEPGWLPNDLYTSGLPCSIHAGDGKCDSIEISLGNSCCPSPDTPCYGDDAPGLSLSVITPANGESVPFDETLWLSAQMSGVSGSYVYRWWLAPADNPEARTRVTPDGADDSFDSAYATWELDPTAAGLSVGRYIVTVEAGYIESTEGCIAGIQEASATFYVVHTVDAVAPGQALAGESIRIYGRTFEPGEEIRALIDDSTGDAVPPYEVVAIATSGRYVDLELPEEMIEGLYFVAVAAADGSGQSIWKQALEVVSPAYTIDGSGDPSCLGSGNETGNSIASGQVITGNWCGQGDLDYYYFSAAKGSVFEIVLERADTSLSIYHPSTTDPELFIADPDEIVSSWQGYSDNISPYDTNARMLLTIWSPLMAIQLAISNKSGLFQKASRQISHS